MAKFETYREGTPSWVEIEAPDPAAAKEFYGDLFGWEYADQPTGDEGGVYSLATIEGDKVAGLSGQVSDTEGQPAKWNVYLATDDVDGAAERALAAGGKVLADPMDVGPAGRMAVVQDPGGAVVGFWQAGETIGAERANEPGTNIWNELTVADVDATAVFYRDVLGLEPEKQDMGDAGEYTTLHVDGASVAGSMPLQPGMQPHWNVYFNVDDVDATVSRAQELGAEVFAPAFDVPGIGRLGYLRDPQGATFNLMQNPPEEG
jgi:predicted enzyme related to lactoylglutathione lyase